MTLRHALAHGNVVYLNEGGNEAPGRRVTHLAFVADGRCGLDAYRVVIVEELAFVEFLKAWADWVARFNTDSSMRRAAQAHREAKEVGMLRRQYGVKTPSLSPRVVVELPSSGF